MSNDLQLRLITHKDERGRNFSTFVAMTNAEFDAFRRKPKAGLGRYRNRVISVICDKKPSREDRDTARVAFAQRFGDRRPAPR